jgi:hypothetical protein
MTGPLFGFTAMLYSLIACVLGSSTAIAGLEALMSLNQRLPSVPKPDPCGMLPAFRPLRNS